jgi:hypothetical protein
MADKRTELSMTSILEIAAGAIRSIPPMIKGRKYNPVR